MKEVHLPVYVFPWLAIPAAVLAAASLVVKSVRGRLLIFGGFTVVAAAGAILQEGVLLKAGYTAVALVAAGFGVWYGLHERSRRAGPQEGR